MHKKVLQSLSTACEYNPKGHTLTRNRVLIGDKAGAKNFSLHHGVIQPGGEAHPHKHDFEQGIYILRGKARISIEGEDTFEVGEDTAIFFPAERIHCISAIGEEELKIIIVYSPPPQ